MSTPRAPVDLTKRLLAYDPRLRARWAVRTKRWIIERKMPERSPAWLTERPSPYSSARGLDLWDGWREGYVFVLGVDPEMFHWSLIEPVLADADAYAQDGFDALNRKLDEIAAKDEAAADKTISNWSEAASHEAFDRLQWLQGNRIATPLAEASESPFVEEQHEGFRVRTKRSLLEHA